MQGRNLKRVWTGLGLALLGPIGLVASLDIEFEYDLPNGLHVILHRIPMRLSCRLTCCTMSAARTSVLTAQDSLIFSST